MRIELDLPEWVIDAIRRGPPPMVDCGPSLEDRIGYICLHWADHVIHEEDSDKRKALYRAFGIEPDREPDIFT